MLSVVIPCFNHGHFIQEAIDSVLAVKGVTYEIIVVNDGSTDDYTIRKLEELRAAGICVLSHANSGLGFTRNKGIEAARGKYILPLDADNKIEPGYVYKALPLLESNACDIVYAKPHFFGTVATDRLFFTRPLRIKELAVVNYIDACAIYRKKVWEQLSGYDIRMPYPGQEDWEFWIHAHAQGFAFAFLDEELFHYRVEKGSMIATTVQDDKSSLNQEYIFRKHAALFRKLYLELYYTGKLREHDIKNPVRTFIKYMYYNLTGRGKTSLPLFVNKS